MPQTSKAFDIATRGEPLEHVCRIEPTSKRIRVFLNGEAIADSTDAVIMHETRHVPVYYLPMADVRMDLMEPTDNKTH